VNAAIIRTAIALVIVVAMSMLELYPPKRCRTVGKIKAKNNGILMLWARYNIDEKAYRTTVIRDAFAFRGSFNGIFFLSDRSGGNPPGNLLVLFLSSI
jgi:hypothetical protein